MGPSTLRLLIGWHFTLAPFYMLHLGEPVGSELSWHRRESNEGHWRRWQACDACHSRANGHLHHHHQARYLPPGEGHRFLLCIDLLLLVMHQFWQCKLCNTRRSHCANRQLVNNNDSHETPPTCTIAEAFTCPQRVQGNQERRSTNESLIGLSRGAARIHLERRCTRCAQTKQPLCDLRSSREHLCYSTPYGLPKAFLTMAQVRRARARASSTTSAHSSTSVIQMHSHSSRDQVSTHFGDH